MERIHMLNLVRVRLTLMGLLHSFKKVEVF